MGVYGKPDCARPYMNAMRRPSPSGRKTHCATSRCRASRSPRAHSFAEGSPAVAPSKPRCCARMSDERVRERDVAEIRTNRARDVRTKREDRLCTLRPKVGDDIDDPPERACTTGKRWRNDSGRSNDRRRRHEDRTALSGKQEWRTREISIERARLIEVDRSKEIYRIHILECARLETDVRAPASRWLVRRIHVLDVRRHVGQHAARPDALLRDARRVQLVRAPVGRWHCRADARDTKQPIRAPRADRRSRQQRRVDQVAELADAGAQDLPLPVLPIHAEPRTDRQRGRPVVVSDAESRSECRIWRRRFREVFPSTRAP